MKPKKLVKSVQLSGLDGAHELSFGKSQADNRMKGDHSKKPKDRTPPVYDDVVARNKRFGFM